MIETQSFSSSAWQTLAEINLPGQPGVDQEAWDHVAGTVRLLNLTLADLERLKTTIVETMLKIIERGHHYRSDLPVSIRLRVSYKALVGAIVDHEDMPGLTTNVSGQESRRGWGFFLIERMMDDTQTAGEVPYYSIELFLYRE